MKRIFLVTIALGSWNYLAAKEIKAFSTYSFGSYNKFQQKIGYGKGYHY